MSNIAVVTSLIMSVSALAIRVAACRRTESRLETRELVVRDREAGPEIHMTASDTVLALRFLAASRAPALTLDYASPQRPHTRQEDSSTTISLVVAQRSSTFGVASGASSLTLHAYPARGGAALFAQGANESAVMKANLSGRDFAATAYQDAGSHYSRVALSELRGGELELGDVVTRWGLHASDGDSGLASWTGLGDKQWARVAATKGGAFVTLREKRGNDVLLPIYLTTGEDASIRLIPGQRGSLNMAEEAR